MTAKRVPSKIVIAGNSKMSLNERFSSIPKPRPRTSAMKAQHVSQVRRVHPRQYEEHIEYVPTTVIRRPRPVVHQRVIPLQNRVSFVKPVPVQRFHQRNTFVQRNPQFQNNFRKPFRPNFNHQGQNRKLFHNNNRFNNQNGFQGRKSFPTVPKKKSLAELDRELEDYMRKPKHTPITI
ncbi:unnamed protein product [Caenorhabditis brenneri]|uniref:Chromatin target of PRMT1 protein C-terminal domain-containing protein n=1 Tax=Caenorhabditis brenneri TaxID=135651 RepID=B6VBA7_CAEBE|nr:hypothetical protein Cbre_JD01.007 [Caenorhabditis brenneri]